MSIVIFTLTAANLLLYFAFASLNPPFAPALPGALAAILAGSAACALGCLVSRKNPRLRFLFIPLPLLPLLLAPDILSLLHLVPAVVYPIVILAAGRFSVFYWDYRNHVLSTSCLILLMLLLSQVRAVRPLPVIFGLASLILGFFTLRQLRFGAQTGAKQKLLELGSLCAVPAAAWLILLLLTKTKEVFRWLMEWIFYPFGLLIQKFVAFLDALINFFHWSDPYPEKPPEEAAPITEFAEGTSPIPQVQNPDETLDVKVVTILLVIAAILAVLFIIWCYRRLRASRSDAVLEERTDAETESDGAIARTFRRAEHRANRRRVRRIYEQYLRLLRQRNFFRQPQDSSQDIVEKTRNISAQQPAQALRELYIQARYHPGAVITETQVRRARQLLQQIREEPEKRPDPDKTA